MALNADGIVTTVLKVVVGHPGKFEGTVALVGKAVGIK